MSSNLASGFLAASPTLACPFFRRSLVLVVDHREDGALGFVVNKASEVSFPEILSEVGIEAPGSERTQVHSGGPVSPETGWLVYRAEGAVEEGVVALDNGLAVSANVELLRQIAHGTGPSSYLMMLGYAGWGPGQLDEEIRQGSWIPVDVDAASFFGIPIEDRWLASLESVGIDPGRIAGTPVADA